MISAVKYYIGNHQGEWTNNQVEELCELAYQEGRLHEKEKNVVEDSRRHNAGCQMCRKDEDPMPEAVEGTRYSVICAIGSILKPSGNISWSIGQVYYPEDTDKYKPHWIKMTPFGPVDADPDYFIILPE